MDRKDNNNNINNKDDVTRVINKKEGYNESGYSYDKGFNDSKEPFGSDSVSSGSKKKKRRNLETNVIAAIFAGLFAVMIIYLLNFTAKEAPTLANSPYDKRNTTTAPPNPIRRGTIFAEDGSVLAATYLNEDGKEYRSYPKGALFAVPVGMERGGGSGIEGGYFEDLQTATNNIVVDEEAADIEKTEYKGNNVYTTLKPYLQQAAYDALGDEKGAIIAMEPSTGKILAMVSKPTYDPNKGGTDYEEWAANNGEDSVLINRATQGLYPPGSCFKILTSLEYLKEEEENFEGFNIHCSGSTHPDGGARINCQWAHGDQNIDRSFVNSCNVAFSTIGLRLDRQSFRQLAESVGFNTESPLDEIETSQSKFYLDGNSEMNEVQYVSFGQGSTLTTPLQTVLTTAMIANGGNMMKPYMVDKVESPDGDTVKFNVPMIHRAGIATKEQADRIGKMMFEMASSLDDVFGSNPYKIAGKTGTAEYENNSDKAHMWFTCFAPYNNPKIAVVCIMERTDIDHTKATTACRKVVSAYLGE